MADNNIPAYPYMFDPSQFSNKYSPYAGKALPWPSSYQGTPTDALGRPIQSYRDAQAAHDAWAAANPPMAPAVTLNTNPTDMTAQRNAALTGQPGAAMAYGANFAPAGSPGGIQQMYGQNFAAFTPQRNWRGNAQPAAQPAAQPTNPIDMNQAYLNALSNPGKVVTPGATVPQSPPPSGQSSVLQQFLANWRGQPTTGAGNYNNAGFFNALSGGGGGGGAGNNIMGNQLSGNMVGPTPPPSAIPGAKDAATAGYLDASGRPTAALDALRQGWMGAQGQWAGV